jgi:hypothetical protein
VLHEGAIRRDPIAIRVEDMRVRFAGATPRTSGSGCGPPLAAASRS